MLKLFLLGVTFLFLATGCLAGQQAKEGANTQQASSEMPEAQADLPTDTWDFGIVKEGEIVEHEFTVTNSSNKVLIVQDVTTSCGCTGSEIKKKKFAPGESTSLEVAFKSAKYSGEITQFVYLHTDDPDNPIIRFIIKANVVK